MSQKNEKNEILLSKNDKKWYFLTIFSRSYKYTNYDLCHYILLH